MQNQNKNLDNFFNPRSIAIVGATDGIGKVGRVVTKNILEGGYSGDVFLVNPSRKNLYGKICYKEINEISEKIDLAIIIIPSDFVCDVVSGAAEKVKNFIVITAGFSESGVEGKNREGRLKRIAREKNLSVLGPNCLGVIFPGIKLNASFSGGLPEKGNVAFISQSGALAVAMMDIFKNKQLGFSGVVSIGNKMDIDEADAIEYFGRDENTKVIGLYLEGIKYGQKFMAVCGEVSRKKPIVILKAGKSEKSREAISSHTGALAGEKKSTSAVFEKCNIIEAENFEQFVDIVKLISFADPPKVNSVLIITNAGGAGVIATDAFEDKSLRLHDFSRGTRDKIKAYLPRAASAHNPIDVLGDAHEDRFRHVLFAVENEPIGSIGILLTPQEQTPVEKIARVIADFSKKGMHTISASFIGGKRVEKGIEILDKAKIANFETPERMVSALEKYYLWGAGKNKAFAHDFSINRKRQKEAGEILEKARGGGRKLLFSREAEKIFNLYGIKTLESWSSINSSAIKYPAVLKIDDGKLAHKTGKNAIFAGIKNHNELTRDVEKIKNHYPNSGYIVQPQSTDHLEIIIGVKKDEIFGPIITFGLGGIYTEYFKMVDFLVPPNEMGEIEDKIKSSQIRHIFSSARGLKNYNISELARIIKAIGNFARECPQICGLDINPLFIYNDGRKAACADIKIFI